MSVTDLAPGENMALLKALMAWHREHPGTSNGPSAEIAHMVAYTMWRAGRDWERARQSADLAAARATIERLKAVIGELIGFGEEHVRLSYRNADVPQMLADPVLRRARAALAASAPAPDTGGGEHGPHPDACRGCGGRWTCSCTPEVRRALDLAVLEGDRSDAP